MSRSERLLAGVAVLAAAAWGWAGRAVYEGPYDEGNTLCAATRVLSGEAPYRDFWTLHPPGTTWLLAGGFRVFGVSLGVERAVKAAVVALAAVLVFRLARRAARPAGAAAAALLFVLLPTQTLSLRSRDTGLALVLATLVAASSPALGQRRRALVAGLLAGLTVWFKQDFVLAAGAGGAVAAAVPVLLNAPAGRRLRAAVSEALVPFAVGLCGGLATLAATLAAHGTFKEFFEQAVLFPATSFERFRSLPLTLRFAQLAGAVEEGISLKGVLAAAFVPIFFVAALAAAVAGIAGAVRALRRGTGEASLLSPAIPGSSVACIFLLAAPFHRADLEHLNPAMALALAVLAMLAAPREWTSRSRPREALAAAAFAAVGVLSLAAQARAARPSFPPDLLAAARFVESVTRSGEPIFVGNARHDRLSYNAPLLYFLADRPNATRYDNLHPGVATTLAVQEEIVRSLEARGVRRIVLWDGPPSVEPNDSSISSGITRLDDWAAARTRASATFGSFRVLEVRPPSAPPSPG